MRDAQAIAVEGFIARVAQLCAGPVVFQHLGIIGGGDGGKLRRAMGAIGIQHRVAEVAESCYERGSCYRIDNNIPSGTCYETCRSIHAEQNAIIQAGQDRCMGATMYIYGHNFICILCKRFIVQAGIKDVYLKKDDNSEILHVSVEDIKRELECPQPIGVK